MAAFRTAKWSVGPKDPSILNFPATSIPAQHKQLCDTVYLMTDIIEHGSNSRESLPGVVDSGSLPKGPALSSKEWASTRTVAQRAVAILRRACQAVSEEPSNETNPVLQFSWQVLIQALLELLDKLLTGELQMCWVK